MSINSPKNSWLNQALRQAPWRTQAQATSLLMALVVVVLVIGALYLAQASRTAAAGRRLQDLDSQRQVLEQQNAQLRAEVAALRSVPRLIAQAEAAGYHVATADEVEYLPMPGPAPALSATPTPFPTASDVVPAYNETLADWLARRLAELGDQVGKIFQSTFGPEKNP